MNKIINLYFKLKTIIYLSFLKVFYFKNITLHISKIKTRHYFHIRIEKTGRLKILGKCFFNNSCTINVMGKITIGNNCLFGENVKIYDHNHRFNISNKNIANSGYSVQEVQIGDNVWVGSNVIILPGTIVGNNCVIGAGCVVSGVIEPNTILKPLTNNYNLEKIIFK